MDMMMIYAGIGGLIVGFVVGMLVMRNNYKHFRFNESDFRDLILDARLNAEQKLLRIRNRLGV